MEPQIARLKKTNELERRSGKERRNNQIPVFKFLLFHGKRHSIRRADDCKRISLLDQYQTTIFVLVLGILGLSLVDAILTIILLEHGAFELNPVMRYYLSLGPRHFVVAKYCITSLPLIIMVILNSMISTRYGNGTGLLMFQFCGVPFGSVVVWELYLLDYIF